MTTLSSKIRQVGFMIADKQAGDFQLEIESIKAY
nr:CIA30 family protein [Nitrosococcus watsonii]